MKKLLFGLIVITVFSCQNENTVKDGDNEEKDKIADSVKIDEGQNIKVKSKYDMSTVDVKDRKEFKENLVKIEKEHGVQWDFCTCVVKNDSINKAFSRPVSDAQFERLSSRFDEIDAHCKAFLAQSPSMTPEERTKHEKKVNKCLKEAGVK